MKLQLRPFQLRLLLVSFGICALLLASGAGLSLLSQQQSQDVEVLQPAGEGSAPEASETPSRATPAVPSSLAQAPLGAATLPPEPTQTRLPLVLFPKPSRTLAPVPTLAPTTTPQPSARLGVALRYQHQGDYQEAIAAYLAILEASPTPLESREVHFRLAESYLLDEQYLLSAAAWQEFISAYSDDDRLPEAALMAARAYRAADECERAVPLLRAHLGPEAVLADLGYEWIGDCHRDNQDLGQALAALRQAAHSARIVSRETRIREKIAAIHQDLGQHELALAEYDAILDLDLGESERARFEYVAGTILSAAGQDAEARERFRRVVDEHPLTPYAYLSLVELLEAGLEVDAFRQGLVGYHAGAAYPEAYRTAMRAFDRYLAQESAPRSSEALYLKALSQRGLGNASSALQTFDELIDDSPQNPWLSSALFEKAVTLARMDRVEEAVGVYRRVAESFPSNELAPRALWEAAELLERGGRPLQAARLYQELQAGFPDDDRAAEALWRAGLALYLAGEAGQATDVWQTLADGHTRSPFAAGALYWLGKLKGAGAPGAKSEEWDQLLSQHPYEYYGLRAAQIRSGGSLTSTRFVTATVESPLWDAAEARAELLAWLNTWAEVPDHWDGGLLELPTTPSERYPYERVGALLDVGMRWEALGEADALMKAAWDDPLSLARLALFLHDQSLHVLAARSAIHLARLWPEGGMYDAPPVVQRLAYPLAYSELLSSEARARNQDPLLLASIIRQESLFEPSAVSVAGARGLGQVMPATGSWIAGRLGRGDFVLDDLFRPSVSIEFGAYYLDWTLGVFDDHILVSLAAYNGGPGNTRRWLEAADYDLDLFVETIAVEESRRYLRKVYEGYAIYEKLYRTRDSGRGTQR